MHSYCQDHLVVFCFLFFVFSIGRRGCVSDVNSGRFWRAHSVDQRGKGMKKIEKASDDLPTVDDGFR